ncbi:MAG: insulinase family protein [Cyclobacteriaceae bacterium]|nr:insulinase family protein [Cyclobacteriaceae bacterium]
MLDRKSPPPFAKEFSFDLPSPTRLQVGNGIDLHWVKGSKDIIKLDFIFQAGKWYEPKPGIAYFTAHMLEKGTANYSASEISEIIDYHGAQLEISAGADFVSISLYSLTKNLRSVLPLLMELLQQPVFPSDELELLLSIYEQNLKVNQQKTSFVAGKLLAKNIFGAQHPYGKSAEESDLKNISREDLMHYHAERFVPFSIFLTGDLSNDEMAWLQQSLSPLKSSFRNQAVSKPIESNDTKKAIVKKDGSVQASLRMGKLCITRADKDYPSFLLLNHILGGYFGSRLMKNIREEKGLTYGIYSSLSPNLHHSSFSIGADVNIDKCDETLHEIGNELTRLQKELISEEELLVAKNHFLGSLQLEVSNPFSVTEKLKTIHLFDLPEQHYSDLFNRIGKTQAKDLQIMAQKHFVLEDFFTVQVG